MLNEFIELLRDIRDQGRNSTSTWTIQKKHFIVFKGIFILKIKKKKKEREVSTTLYNKMFKTWTKTFLIFILLECIDHCSVLEGSHPLLLSPVEYISSLTTEVCPKLQWNYTNEWMILFCSVSLSLRYFFAFWCLSCGLFILFFIENSMTNEINNPNYLR